MVRISRFLIKTQNIFPSRYLLHACCQLLDLQFRRLFRSCDLRFNSATQKQPTPGVDADYTQNRLSSFSNDGKRRDSLLPTVVHQIRRNIYPADGCTGLEQWLLDQHHSHHGSEVCNAARKRNGVIYYGGLIELRVDDWCLHQYHVSPISIMDDLIIIFLLYRQI